MPMDKWPSKHVPQAPRPPQTPRAPDALDAPDANRELTDFVRAFVARFAASLGEGREESIDPSPGPNEHVLFDLDVDGERYLLIKIVPQARCGASLSPREREIVRMVAHGHPNKVIAAVLCISAWTVCTHLRRIFAKLGVSSRAAMVAKAAEAGLVLESPPPGARARRTHA